MTAASASVCGRANLRGADSAPGMPKAGSIQAAIAACARAISPGKTWAYLAGALGLGERVAKHRLAGSREFTIDELASLLRSERGIDYLVAVMADAEPSWWRAFKQQTAIADALRLQRAARRKLHEAVDADADLTAAIARADALLVHDEDFYRPQLDARRAVARVPDCPMAAVAKRGR